MILPEWLDCTACLKSSAHWTSSLGMVTQASVALGAVFVAFKATRDSAPWKKPAFLIAAGSLVALLFGVTARYTSDRLVKIQESEIQVLSSSVDNLTPATQNSDQGRE